MDKAKFLALCTILGISATSVDDDALRAAEALRDERDDAKEKLEERDAADKLREEQAAKKLADEQAATTKSKIAELVKAGKLKTGGSPRQERLERLSKRDHEEFLAQVAEMLDDESERVTPAGKTPVVLGSRDIEPKPGDEILEENPEIAKSLKAAGITKEEFEKHGARARQNIAAKRAAGW